MSFESSEAYKQAVRAGQRHYRDCLRRGTYPYPAVLDEILDDALVAGYADLGVLEIPSGQIAGTKTVGRRTAFAANFMPLLSGDTEFAAKWMGLCDAHLGDAGIRDPIRCYEYLGRFYVQEGNKRVSVLKYFDAPTIPGYVIRLLPVRTEEPEVGQYYEFLGYYQQTGLYQVYFTQSGQFPKLQAALGYEAGHVWTEEEQRRFLSGFFYFQRAFRKLGGGKFPITAADALLVWLGVYPFEMLSRATAAELARSLETVWPDVKVLAQTEPIAVETEAQDRGMPLLNRIVSAISPPQIQVAFINERDAASSTWIRAHEQGRRHLEETLGSRVAVRVYDNVGTGEEAEEAMERAVREGAQVIFTTTVSLIGLCRKIAARHPHVHLLNCSVSMPYTGVRTYYSRIYEGKFISGAIVGAMSQNDRVGYVASSPIYGVPAGINAFALGAQLTNPRARVRLLWSCLPGDPMEELKRQGIDLVSALDVSLPERFEENRGAYRILPDGAVQLLASPYWNWGAFYVKIVNSILNGSWDEPTHGKKGKPAVNYWWGMSSGVIGMQFSELLPDGVRSLAGILQKGIIDGSLSPFHRRIRSQDGVLRNDGSKWFTPGEILHMDWLCDNVDGYIPEFEQLLPKAQPMGRLLGIHRERIPPEQKGLLL